MPHEDTLKRKRSQNQQNTKNFHTFERKAGREFLTRSNSLQTVPDLNHRHLIRPMLIKIIPFLGRRMRERHGLAALFELMSP